MAINKNKIVAIAQRHTAKGHFEKAITEYQKLIKADPADIRTWLKIGDLYTRMGARKEATDTYLRVAEQYSKSGFHLKAIAVHKQVLKIDPTLVDIHQYLAKSYLELGLNSEALIQLEQLVDIYQRTGREEPLLAVLLRMGELDPRNIATRLRIAEHLSRENRAHEAVEHFAIACDELKKQGRIDDFLKVAERLLYHDSSRVELARETASIYLKRKQYKQALAKLQMCFVKNPRDLNTLELLANAFSGLEQPDKAASVYKEMFLLLQGPEHEGERTRVLEAILAIDPENEMALEQLGRSAAPEPKPHEGQENSQLEMEVQSYAEASHVASSEEDSEALEDEAYEELSNVGSLSEEEIEKRAHEILSEATVLVKYGLSDRALDHLERIFEFDPYNIDARERTKDVLLEQGRVEEALEQLFLLADVFSESQPEGAVYYLHEILRIDPENARAREMIEALGGVMPEDLEEPPKDTALEDDAPIIAEDDENVYVIDDAPLASVGQTAEAEELSAATQADIQPEEASETGEEGLTSALQDDSAPEDQDGIGGVTDPDQTSIPEYDLSDFDLDDVADMSDRLDTLDDPTTVDSDQETQRRGTALEEEIEDISLDDMTELSAEDDPTAGDLAMEREPSGPLPKIEDELEEIEFFVDQGLYNEAQGVLKDLTARYPDDPRVQEAAGFLDRNREALDAADEAMEEEAQRPSFAPDLIDDDFDLIEIIEDSESITIEEVIEGSKITAAHEIEEADYATHYDLGLAYKEMGLFDNAIAEFEKAAGDPAKIGLVKTMIGICYNNLEKRDDAVKAFEEGLQSQHLDEQQELGLLYELGVTFQMMRRNEEAMACFEKIAAIDPNFADIGGRIAALSGEQGTPSKRGVFS
ncbi:MAG: tetratricopeptide repeat protein [Myxococcota bacterium]|nr:tetratricopeptide repeat protein [Myxococcota bacterium]